MSHQEISIQETNDNAMVLKRDRDKEVKLNEMVYTVNQNPPWYIAIVLGLQHYLTMFGGTVSVFFVVSAPLCIDKNLVLKAEMLGTVFFVMGITTMLNATFGIRLPIIQGTTASLLLPVLSMAATFGDCPEYDANQTLENYTTEVVEPRIQLVSGTIMVGSIIQMLIGLSGAVTILLRFVGPLVIAPTITLIGLSLFKVAAMKSSGQWYIALSTSLLICIFTYFLSRLRVPCITRDSATKKFRIKRYPIFQTLPVILGIAVAWIICAILTATDALPSDSNAWGHSARTDTKASVLRSTPWLQFPYPGRWGPPRVYAAGLLGLAAGFVTSVVESVGDYFACARMAGAPPPPIFAVNRAITIEGFGCFLAGLLGLPIGTTSYSENVGAIGITRIGSRRVVQVAACFMLIFGIISKLGAVFVSIPDPIYGGVFLTMFGMLSGVGLSTLQFINLNSSRNLFVIGSALFLGLAIPEWVSTNGHTVDLGNEVVNTTVRMLLSIQMFVGGFLAFVLDLALPGSREERGIDKWRKIANVTDEDSNRLEILKTYDLRIATRLFRRFDWLRYFPVCPTYSKYQILANSKTNPNENTRV